MMHLEIISDYYDIMTVAFFKDGELLTIVSDDAYNMMIFLEEIVTEWW